MLEAQALEKLASGGEWFIEKRPAVEPQKVKDH